MKTYIKTNVLLFCCVLVFASSSAQVGISTNNPNKNAVLDLNKNDGTHTKGLVLPKVALSSTDTATPMEAHVAGMKVYNTATAGTGIYAVTPGEYYNDGTKWIATSNAWLPDGNVNGLIKSIGTNDNNDLPVITNNTEKMRVTTGGKVLLNTSVPLPGGVSTKVQINNGAVPGAMQIVDGTQGADKVLTSDGNGMASWKPATSLYTVLGVIPAATTSAVTISNTIFYTGCYIDLPAGKWNVFATMWFSAGGTGVYIPAYNNAGFTSFFLSTSSSSNIPPAYASNLTSVILQPLYFSGSNSLDTYGSGSIPITLTTAKRIYVWGYVYDGTYVLGLPATPNLTIAKISSANNNPGAYGPYTQLYATPITF